MSARWLVLWVVAGCVTKGRHEVVEVQLGATRTALSARTAQCVVDQRESETTRMAVEAEIARRQLQLDELSARGAATDQELASVQTARLALLDELARLEVELKLARELLAKKGVVPGTPPTITSLARDEVVAQLDAHLREEIERQRLEAARIAVDAAFAGLVAEGRAEVLVRGSSAVVRIPTGLLFQEGFSTLSPRGQQIVNAAAEALAHVPGRRVTIEGHTDDRPVHSAEFPSNWERAFSRAVAVLRALEGAGAPAVLSASSFAGTRPIAPNDTDDGRSANERVELVIDVDPDLLQAFAPTPPPDVPEAPPEEPAQP